MNAMKKIKFITFLCCLLPLIIWAQPTKEVLTSHVTYLSSNELEGRGLGTKGKDLAEQYIISAFEKAGLIPFITGSYTQKFNIKSDLAWIEATNIIGFIPGSDPKLKDEYIVIGAHYDHLGYKLEGKNKIIFPGADDNASGVASIIELAKTLNKKEFRQKRSIIIIAFDAEESGLLGSEHFIENLEPTVKQNIKAMFSLDMVGMLGANKGLILKGVNTIVSAKESAIKIAASSGIELLDTSSAIEQRTDTKSFGEAGIPSVHVFTGLKSPYHRPEDAADLLDYAGMLKIHDFMVSFLTDLNQMQVIESSKSLKEKLANPEKISKRFQFGLIFSLGSGQHLYSDEFFDAKTAFSFNGGIQLNYKLNKNFNIQVEALVDHNASRSAEGRYKRHSFTVPVNLEYGTSSYTGEDNVRFFGFLGPYFRNNFGGTNGNDDLNYDLADETTEWGISFGVGFDVQKFRIAYTYRQGLNSIYNDNRNVLATGNYLTLGYRF
jgi:hypothetical protein